MDIKALMEQKQDIDRQLGELRELLCENSPPVAVVRQDRIARPGDYVVVCTDKRGVFFGQVESLDEEREECILTEIRNCIHWSSDVGGFGGLLKRGPTPNCRIGAVIPRGRINGLTFVGRPSNEAVKAWESAPTHR